MAHTYATTKSWVDLSRPGVYCGYVSITLADDLSSSAFAIDASDINANCSTIYQLNVLNQHDFLLDATVPCLLSWDYADQSIVATDVSDGADPAAVSDVDALVGNVIFAYYEGS